MEEKRIMFNAPFVMPGDFETGVPPNATPPQMMDGMGGMMVGGPQPHLTFAGAIVALLGLKFLTESNLITFDVHEVKVSLHNILNIGIQASVFIVGAKVVAGFLLQKGYPVSGFADFVGAL
jgi:hypothetical protein